MAVPALEMSWQCGKSALTWTWYQQTASSNYFLTMTTGSTMASMRPTIDLTRIIPFISIIVRENTEDSTSGQRLVLSNHTVRENRPCYRQPWLPNITLWSCAIWLSYRELHKGFNGLYFWLEQGAIIVYRLITISRFIL